MPARTANLIFLAKGLQPVPLGKAYELWLLPAAGKPVPAGVFKPDAQGQAAMVNPPVPVGLQAKGFAVTLENEAGSEQPTSPILLVGTT
jgi:anti-sigma-K factor RskA